MISLRFFAQLSDEARGRERTVPLAPTPLALLAADPGGLSFLKPAAVRVCVNDRWARWDSPLSDGDEVAFLPPWNAF